MTLAQWAELWPYRVSQHPSGAWWTPDTFNSEHHPARVRAFRLTDVAVSSVTGGSIWFVARDSNRPLPWEKGEAS